MPAPVQVCARDPRWNISNLNRGDATVCNVTTTTKEGVLNVGVNRVCECGAREVESLILGPPPGT